MPRAWKLKYASHLAGIFVLVVTACLFAGIILAGKTQGWFEPSYTVKIRLPSEGSFGLRRGAEVIVMETPVGVVDELQLDDFDNMEAVLKLKGDFVHFVRQDSSAVIRKKFAVAGDAYVDISRGRGEKIPDSGFYLECRADTDLIEELQSMVLEVRSASTTLVEKVNRLLDEHIALAASLSQPDGNLQASLVALRTVMEGLAKGEGAAGVVLRDPEGAQKIRDTLEHIRVTSSQAEAALKKIREASAVAPTISRDVAETMEKMPLLVSEFERLLVDIELLAEGLQRHWLLRKYMDVPDHSEKLPMHPGGGK